MNNEYKGFKKCSTNTYRANVYGILFYYNTILGKNFGKFKFGKLKKKLYPLVCINELQMMLNQTKNKEDKLLIKFLYSTGLRVAECSDMRIEHAF